MTKTPPIFLIVDKEVQPENVIKNFSSYFHMKNQSIHCFQVHTAAECLKMMMTHKNIGVVVVDENLPDISGLTLVSLLKRMKPEVEIIFTTGCHDPQKEIDARLVGILYYGVKPVDWSLLGQIVERTLTKQNKTLLLSNH
jgi:DNA-binding NtrC family response regulator